MKIVFGTLQEYMSYYIHHEGMTVTSLWFICDWRRDRDAMEEIKKPEHPYRWATRDGDQCELWWKGDTPV